jgi:Raf kinase inhibitor-like YbhB/YbcL family protein
MKISSGAFRDHEAIPRKYTCEGEDVSPPLRIESTPGGTKALALIVDDPDAPGGIFDHWLVWNLDPLTTELAEGAIGDDLGGALEGKNSFGGIGYRGPCPPSGTHRYRFQAYALKKKLDLPEGATREQLESAMEGQTLEHVSCVGTYSRSEVEAA